VGDIGRPIRLRAGLLQCALDRVDIAPDLIDLARSTCACSAAMASACSGWDTEMPSGPTLMR
jgi:hypothetical protein